jgi:hypothetical protein
LKPGLVKGPWTLDEDEKLKEWVKKEGTDKWSACSAYISGRSGKQCRERWFNILRPEVKRGSWSPEEDKLIFRLYHEFGSHWTTIATHLPGRTENSIKNRFYSTLRKYTNKSKPDELPLMETKLEELPVPEEVTDTTDDRMFALLQ